MTPINEPPMTSTAQALPLAAGELVEGRTGAAAGGGQATGGREREAEHRRADQHLQASHLPLEDLVDQVLAVLLLEFLRCHRSSP